MKVRFRGEASQSSGKSRLSELVGQTRVVAFLMVAGEKVTGMEALVDEELDCGLFSKGHVGVAKLVLHRQVVDKFTVEVQDGLAFLLFWRRVAQNLARRELRMGRCNDMKESLIAISRGHNLRVPRMGGRDSAGFGKMVTKMAGPGFQIGKMELWKGRSGIVSKRNKGSGVKLRGVGFIRKHIDATVQSRPSKLEVEGANASRRGVW